MLTRHQTSAGIKEKRATDAPRNARKLLWLFTITIFLNAALLFAVQPMFSKMVLPLLGGSSAVWTTCMLFFQAVLLAGYFYAHVVPRWIGTRRHAVLHMGLLVLSLLTLPIAVRASWEPAAYANPVPPLLGLLTVSLGIPFFLLSSGSPLLQRWFSHTAHPSADNPYFLYAASNLGSMLALLGYPLLMEPGFRLQEQSLLWTGGYWALTAVTAACAVLVWRDATHAVRPPVASPADVNAPVVAAAPASAGPVDGATRLRWILLAFVPSSLLLGVTTFLTTDIASVPMLWVVPLALYLLTFVLAFARRPLIPQPVALRIQPYLLLPLIIAMFVSVPAWPTAFLPVHLGAFFISALICHAELARTRPHVRHLTEFYLWISVGGVLGGVFNVILAPQIFTTGVAEYPFALVLAALLRPAPSSSTRRQHRLDVLLPAALGLAAAAMLAVYPAEYRLPALMAIGCVAAVIVFGFQRRPIRFGLGLGTLLLAGAVVSRDVDLVHVERSFFGVHRVERDPGGYHLLVHGSTIHGAQSLDPDRRLQPLSYYHAAGPLGQLFDALPVRPGGRRVAVVGLGTGSMACHGAAADRWTWFEIDPAVERIARDPRFFTFMRDCPPPVDVVIGDARLTMAADTGPFDLLVLDAFSSDAIPIHLLTREALDLYLDRLAPGGVIAVHISNRHLDLQPVIAGLAADADLAGRHQYYSAPPDIAAQQGAAAHWAVLARSEADLAGVADDPRWAALVPSADVGLWSDDFSNILAVLKRGRR